MALSNYGELKTSIASLLNRDDLATAIPDLIALAQAQIDRDIRHWQMEKRATLQQSATDEYAQLPSDWVETIRLHVTGSGTSVVDLISRNAMANKRAGAEDTTGIPAYYCHADGQLQFYPTPSSDTDLEMLYYGKITAMSSDSDYNWLLTSHPDIYLYGAALHSAPYLDEDDRIAVWAQLYSAAVQRLNEVSEKARYSGSGLRLKNRGLG